MKICRKEPAGFTLIELLVATAIIALMLAIFSQLVGGITKIYQFSQARTENNNLGRAILDSMATDLKQAIIRPDLEFIAEKNTAAVRSIKFYCQRPGTFRAGAPGSNMTAARSASIVEYVFYRDGNDKGYIARRDRPVSWTTSQTVIPIGNTTAISDLDSVTEETRIYEGMVGFDYCYLRSDGSVDSSLTSGTLPIVALRVAVAVVEKSGLQLLKARNQLGDMVNVFSGNGTIQNAGIKTWTDCLNQQGARFPNRVVQGVSFYERTVPLSTPYIVQ